MSLFRRHQTEKNGRHVTHKHTDPRHKISPLTTASISVKIFSHYDMSQSYMTFARSYSPFQI